MGLNGKSVTGIAARDNCVGAGGCVVNHCSGGCNTSGAFLAYAHYPNCGPGTAACNAQTGIPIGTGCGTTYRVQRTCGGNQSINATLWECGPQPRSASTGRCPGTKPLIACLNDKAIGNLGYNVADGLWNVTIS
jgi:hypothetical protein